MAEAIGCLSEGGASYACAALLLEQEMLGIRIRTAELQQFRSRLEDYLEDAEGQAAERDVEGWMRMAEVGMENAGL